MTQLSRPFQIALLAMGLLVAVWFVALRGHSSSTSGSGSPASASAPSASAQAGKATTPGTPKLPLGAAEEKAAAAPTPIYHGSAPGVAGLTRVIAQAHKAVAESQQEVKQREAQSTQASSVNPTGPATSASTTSSQPTPSTTQSRPATASPPKSSAGTSTAHATGGAGRPSATQQQSALIGVPAKQALVEHALKEGKVAVVLFWNPRGDDDVAVRRELQAVGQALGGKIAVYEASASQVTSFGSITREVQVYQTPTILIVNKHGQIRTLTGLADAFSIEQGIDEARQS
jgi:hypothetical protein